MQYSGTRGAWGPTEQEPVDDKPLNIVIIFPSISIVHSIGNRAVRNLGAGGRSPLHPQISDRIEANVPRKKILCPINWGA